MNDERRKYFRIQDSVMVTYQVIQAEAADSIQREAQLNQVRVETAQAALYGIETDLQELCTKLADANPLFSDAIQMINRKINLLERVISSEILSSSNTSAIAVAHNTKSVNLSGGGLSLEAPEPIAIGATLIMDMVLLPSHEPMRIFGKVVHCDEIDREHYELGIEFSDIRNQDRERLIRHTLQRQAEQIRVDKDHQNPIGISDP